MRWWHSKVLRTGSVKNIFKSAVWYGCHELQAIHTLYFCGCFQRMTQENFVKLHSLQARSLGLLIAKNLIESFIKAFEMFKSSKETFEKNYGNFCF